MSDSDHNTTTLTNKTDSSELDVEIFGPSGSGSSSFSSPTEQSSTPEYEVTDVSNEPPPEKENTERAQSDDPLLRQQKETIRKMNELYQHDSEEVPEEELTELHRHDPNSKKVSEDKMTELHRHDQNSEKAPEEERRDIPSSSSEELSESSKSSDLSEVEESNDKYKSTHTKPNEEQVLVSSPSTQSGDALPHRNKDKKLPLIIDTTQIEKKTIQTSSSSELEEKLIPTFESVSSSELDEMSGKENTLPTRTEEKKSVVIFEEEDLPTITNEQSSSEQSSSSGSEPEDIFIKLSASEKEKVLEKMPDLNQDTSINGLFNNKQLNAVLQELAQFKEPYCQNLANHIEAFKTELNRQHANISKDSDLSLLINNMSITLHRVICSNEVTIKTEAKNEVAAFIRDNQCLNTTDKFIKYATYIVTAAVGIAVGIGIAAAIGLTLGLAGAATMGFGAALSAVGLFAAGAGTKVGRDRFHDKTRQQNHVDKIVSDTDTYIDRSFSA